MAADALGAGCGRGVAVTNRLPSPFTPRVATRDYGGHDSVFESNVVIVRPFDGQVRRGGGLGARGGGAARVRSGGAAHSA